MKKRIGRVLQRGMSAVFSMSVLLSAVSAVTAVPAAAASDCVIDTSVTYQTIRGFGGINLPEWITQGDMTDAQVQKAFGNGEDELGLTILRIYVSDDSNAWSRAVPTAKRAQALGATVFASPWNPPSSIRVSGGSNGRYTLDRSQYGNYAAHLNSYIKYMEGQGINLYSVSVQNEPDYASEWTYWSADDCAYFLANYGKQVTEGTNAKMMSMETFQYGKTYYNAILNNAQAFANCDLFGTHFYGTQRSQMDFPALESCGKDIWMTEVYVPDSTSDADTYPQAVQVAENIHNGLVVGNMNAYVWWYIRRSYGPMKEDGNISKRGYCLAQYSKWVRPGDVRIEATESPDSNLLISAYQNDAGQVTVVAVNKGDSDVVQNFVFSNGEKISGVDRYRTSANENLAKTADMAHSDSNFYASLPANSVSTFVVSVGEAEPDPDGYYYHDTYESNLGIWSGRGAASVALSQDTAYAGSQSMLVSGRTASWNGATRTLSTSVFKPGESYSFSADVCYTAGSATETFYLTLQYTGSDGEAHYDKIATATAVKGEWVQLANTDYMIPAGASNLQIYVETDASTIDFYVDEAIGAPRGTVIAGPSPVQFTRGDINGDGKINVTDLTLAKRILLGSLIDSSASRAADVDQNGEVTLADIIWYVKFLSGQTDSFPDPV